MGPFTKLKGKDTVLVVVDRAGGLHPPSSHFTSLIMSLRLGVPSSRCRLALSPCLLACIFPASLSTPTVGNNGSPMFLMAGTTGPIRRKHYNRPQSISPLSSLPLEAAKSDIHRVSDRFYGYWVFPTSSPASSPAGLVLLLSYSYYLLSWLAPYCCFAFPVASPQTQPPVRLSRPLALSQWQMSTPWLLE